MKKLLLLFALGLLFQTCRKADPEPQLGQLLTLTPGDSVVIRVGFPYYGTLRMALDRVDDTRCPENTTCPMEGQAALHFRLRLNDEEIPYQYLFPATGSQSFIFDRISPTGGRVIETRVESVTPYPTLSNRSEPRRVAFRLQEEFRP